MQKIFILPIFALLLALCACSSNNTNNNNNPNTPGEPEAPIYNAGTYTGVGQGLNGDVTVDVTVSDTKITDVKVTGHQETEGIADPALADVPAAIIEQQNFEVDIVSGATWTSLAIMDAVEEALQEAAKA